MFLTARPHGSQTHVASDLARSLANRVGSLKAREVRTLSRTFVEHFGLEPSHEHDREELRDLCFRVAQEPACLMGSRSASEKLGELELDAVSLEATEVPSNLMEDVTSNGSDSWVSIKDSDHTSTHMGKREIKQSFFDLGSQPKVSTGGFYLPLASQVAAPSPFMLDLNTALLAQAQWAAPQDCNFLDGGYTQLPDQINVHGGECVYHSDDEFACLTDDGF